MSHGEETSQKGVSDTDTEATAEEKKAGTLETARGHQERRWRPVQVTRFCRRASRFPIQDDRQKKGSQKETLIS
jgi:hypothetical protein